MRPPDEVPVRPVAAKSGKNRRDGMPQTPFWHLLPDAKTAVAGLHTANLGTKSDLP